MEEAVEQLAVGLHHLGVAARHLSGEIQPEHAAHAVGAARYASFTGGGGQAIDQLAGALAQAGVEAFSLNQLERGQPGSHRHRVAGQRASLIHRTQRGDAGHDVGAAAKGANRHAAAHHLAQRGQVRADAVQLLRAAQRHTEAGHHFIVNQHRAMAGTQLAQRGDKLGAGADQIHIAGKRLQNHTSQLVAQLGKGLRQLFDVVVFQHQGVAGEIRRHAARAGRAKGQQARAGFHQQAVGMAVVAAFKLDDLVTAGKAARQADGAHGGFGAGRHQAHRFNRRHQLDDFFGDQDFGFGRRAKRQAVHRRRLHGGNHFGVGVANNGRAPGANVVNILGVVGIPQIRALAALEKNRRAAHAAKGAHRRVDAAGDGMAGAFKKGVVATHECASCVVCPCGQREYGCWLRWALV